MRKFFSNRLPGKQCLIFTLFCLLVQFPLFFLWSNWVSFDNQKPLNISTAKEQVMNYYESGKYALEVADVVKRAKELFGRIIPKENSVVLFDIDDTTLSSYEFEKKYQFCYRPIEYHEFVLKGEMQAVPHIKELYDFLLDRGFKIIFLTGRPTSEMEASIQNLSKWGFTKFEMLVTRNEALYKDAKSYKQHERAKLMQRYQIVGSIADQLSDFENPEHLGKFDIKMPNYLYKI